jgi:hypothetical protein
MPTRQPSPTVAACTSAPCATVTPLPMTVARGRLEAVPRRGGVGAGGRGVSRGASCGSQARPKIGAPRASRAPAARRPGAGRAPAGRRPAPAARRGRPAPGSCCCRPRARRWAAPNRRPAPKLTRDVARHVDHHAVLDVGALADGDGVDVAWAGAGGGRWAGGWLWRRARRAGRWCARRWRWRWRRLGGGRVGKGARGARGRGRGRWRVRSGGAASGGRRWRVRPAGPLPGEGSARRRAWSTAPPPPATPPVPPQPPLPHLAGSRRTKRCCPCRWRHAPAPRRRGRRRRRAPPWRAARWRPVGGRGRMGVWSGRTKRGTAASKLPSRRTRLPPAPLCRTFPGSLPPGRAASDTAPAPLTSGLAMKGSQAVLGGTGGGGGGGGGSQ